MNQPCFAGEAGLHMHGMGGLFVGKCGGALQQADNQAQ